MAKLTIPNISSGFNSTTTLNNAFDAIESELNSKVLYRNNPAGEPNQMENDLDMNGYSILNVAGIGSGTVTSVSVASANGFTGTVANSTTTPNITLRTSITGLLKGNGTAISAASSGTDYAPATSGTSILYGNGSGGFSNATIGSGLSFTGGTLSATGGGGSSNLDGLTDVVITSPLSGQVLKYNGTNWINDTDSVGSGSFSYPLGTGIVVVTSGTSWGTTLTAPTGTIVGTTDTQTLTNKTLTSPIISSISNTGTLTLPTSTDTLVGRTTTDTLTNKRISSRVSTTTSSATPTINTDNVDMFGLTALAVNITSFTTNLSGTPTDGQKLWIYIVGTAARTITWGASFEASTIALPTTTVTTNRLDVGFVWNAATSKWRCVAVA